MDTMARIRWTTGNTLPARLFGGAFLMHGLVRLWAGLYPQNKPVRQLAVVSYLIALGTLSLEARVYKTVDLKSFAPIATGCTCCAPPCQSVRRRPQTSN